MSIRRHPGETTSRETLLAELNRHLENLNIGAYVDLFERPWRMIGLNLLAGVFRGLGMALGFFLLSAVLVYVLSQSFVTHLPVVGKFIARVISIVLKELHMGGRI